MIPDGFRLGLIGYPLGHSLSPRLHQVALESTGLTGEYRLYPIPPLPERTGRLQVLVDLLRRQEIHGLNVTIPYKEEIMSYLDEVTPMAQAIGATNTLISTGGRVVGDNTDAPGFWADLIRSFPLMVDHPSTALILGAGGAARAVASTLLRAGWKVTVAARSIEKAHELIQGISSIVGNVPLYAIRLSCAAVGEWLTSSALSTTGITLIVNATPVGMSPQPNASPWPKGVHMPEGAFVYDLVYNPAETLLVSQARQAGLVATSGLGMLVEQAALAFERWTEMHPDRQAMYQAVSKSKG